MLRRDVLKGVVGGAAAVALGEMFGGKAEARDRCVSVNYYCATSCSPNCRNSCRVNPSCPGCTICDYDNCDEEDTVCGDTCDLACYRACGPVRGRKTNCEACEVCWPPE